MHKYFLLFSRTWRSTLLPLKAYPMKDEFSDPRTHSSNNLEQVLNNSERESASAKLMLRPYTERSSRSSRIIKVEGGPAPSTINGGLLLSSLFLFWKNFRIRKKNYTFIEEPNPFAMSSKSEVSNKTSQKSDILIRKKFFAQPNSVLTTTLDTDRSQGDLSSALKKRNISRIFILFFLHLSHLRSLHVDESQDELRSFSVFNKFELHHKPRLRSYLKFESTTRPVMNLLDSWNQYLRRLPRIHKASLAIPYVFVSGIFLTFFTIDQKGTHIHNLEKIDSRAVTTEMMRESSTQPRLSISDLEIMNSSEIYSKSWTLAELRASKRPILFFCFESLRISTVCSKIFLLWGILQIWRGIRPGQSTLQDTRLQLRIISPEQNKKSLKDVQGIEKYQTILKICVDSIYSNQSFFQGIYHAGLPFLLSRLKAGSLIGRDGSKKTSRKLSAPKGYLFLGPPGSGKTLCAQAIAGEAQVPLLCLSASEIQKQIESGTKIGAIRVRNLFKQTRAHTPCILFLDEIDSLAHSDSFTDLDSEVIEHTKKINNLTSGQDQQISFLEKNQNLAHKPGFNGEVDQNKLNFESSLSPQMVIASRDALFEKLLSSNKSKKTGSERGDRAILTEFLVQMDSFSIQDGFCVIGTTNFLDLLDSAFIRSGRFDRLLTLSYPGKKDRQQLLKFYGQSSPQNKNFFIFSSFQVTKITTLWGHFSKFMKKRLGSTKSLETKLHGDFVNKQVDVDWTFWAEQTQGLSAADIAKIMNESSLYLIRKKFTDWSAPRTHSYGVKTISSPETLKHTAESIQKGLNIITARKNF